MEKEKRKGRPQKYRYILAGVAVILLLSICYCGWFVTRSRSLSYFSRFENSDEVVDFLYQNLEPNSATKDDVLTFMSDYPLKQECREFTATDDYDRQYIGIPDNAETGIFCSVPYMERIFGTLYYNLLVYFDTNGLLVYIDVTSSCPGCP